MKCIKCGVLLPTDANFCDMCGAEQRNTKATKQNEKAQKGNINRHDKINALIDEWLPKIFVDQEKKRHSNVYTYTDIQNPKNTRVLKNIRDNMYLFYDTALRVNIPEFEIQGYVDGNLDSGKSGIIFTRIGFFYKERLDSEIQIIPYDKIYHLRIGEKKSFLRNFSKTFVTFDRLLSGGRISLQVSYNMSDACLLRDIPKAFDLSTQEFFGEDVVDYFKTDDIDDCEIDYLFQLEKDTFENVTCDLEKFEQFLEEVLAVRGFLLSDA